MVGRECGVTANAYESRKLNAPAECSGVARNLLALGVRLRLLGEVRGGLLRERLGGRLWWSFRKGLCYELCRGGGGRPRRGGVRLRRRGGGGGGLSQPKTTLNHEKCCHTSTYLDLGDLGSPGNTMDCVGVRWSALENSMCVGVRWKPRNVRWCALEKSPNVRWSTLECVGLRWKSARLGRF